MLKHLPTDVEKLTHEYQNKFSLKTDDIMDSLAKLIKLKQEFIGEEFIESQNSYRESLLRILVINILIISFFILLGIYTGKIIKQPIESIKNRLDKVSEGDFSVKIDYQYKDEILDLSKSLNSMIDSLKKAKESSDSQNWLKDGINQLSNILADEKDLDSLSNKVVSFR